LFENNKTNLIKSNKQALDLLAKQLLENKSTHISVEGYTDNVGVDSLNQKLSEERENSVTVYLLSKGIEQSQLSTKGLGSKNPIASNLNEKGRIKNRRVEIRILKYRK
jgi:outer membrane protein OmpA-like peptidoglycan-associated protein